jgi:hypothetical protein
MSCDLLSGIREGIKGLIDLLAKDLVLNRHDGCQKYIIQGFGFDANVKLLHAEGETTHELLHRANDEIKAGLHKATELSKSFNDPYFSCADDEATRNAHGDGLADEMERLDRGPDIIVNPSIIAIFTASAAYESQDSDLYRVALRRFQYHTASSNASAGFKYGMPDSVFLHFMVQASLFYGVEYFFFWRI